MSEKKTEMIAFRVPETLKNQLSEIAERETRSISQQVEHFVKQGIREYLKTKSPPKKK